MNNASYEVVKLSDSDRYWFRREYCDTRYEKSRLVLVSLEKTGFGDTDISGVLPWNIWIDDRRSMQFWRLIKMSIDGEEKMIFERVVKTNRGGKSDNLSLGYVPNWLIEEIKQVAYEMKEQGIAEEGRKFLESLVEKIVEEKKQLKEKLSAVVSETKINGLFHILTQTKGDDRGSFREVVRFPEIEVLTGYDFVGKQVNHSFSVYGTLRGLHVEPWAKLVTVVSGLAVSYLLDTRPQSPTFGKVEKFYLGFGKTPDGQEITGGALFIEPGIANSVLTLSEKMNYTYVVDDLWTPATATYAVNPMDPKLALPWTEYVPEKEIIRSERDMTSQMFDEFIKKVS